MYQKRLIEAISEIDSIQYAIRQAKIDPANLQGTALDLDECDQCANLLDSALNKLESALSMMAGN